MYHTIYRFYGLIRFLLAPIDKKRIKNRVVHKFYYNIARILIISVFIF